MTQPTKDEYLQEMSEELHKPVRRKFPRLSVSFKDKDETFCLDLADMQRWASDNNGYKYILVCIDGFTRYAWAEPLKDKTALSVFAAFKKIIKEGRRPQNIWCDMGKEFVNSLFAKEGYSSKAGTMYHTFGESKSVIVERLNRTLKTEMWKMCYRLNTLNWVSVLPSLLSWYNNKQHSTLGMSPLEASMAKNKAAVGLQVNHLVEKPPKNDPRIPKFALGDWVRVSRAKGPFTKGYEAGWSVEQFKVASVIRPNNVEEPLMYRLEDYTGEKIDGSFYGDELQTVAYPEIYLIDRVLKEKGSGKNKMYYVSWVGYSDKFNSWIKKDDTLFDFSKKS